MNAKDLELKIAGLEKAIQEHKADTSRYEDELKQTSKQLKDYNKIALPPAVFDDIYEAVESGVDKFDFSDTDNFEIEYGINYDGKVNCDHHELCNSDDLVQMIVDKVSELFVEKLDTTEADNHA
jgi:hypothetical protein|tara:strand:+ start:159 stop:530 length:372 start_codon:yes stop_codon:yes gene_type:complete